MKELKNKEVRNLLIFLISVVFRINLKVKILLHNFQDLTTKIMKRKRQILTHFKWAKIKEVTSLNKLKNLIVLINNKIIKVVTVASVLLTWMLIVKANKIIKAKLTGKILENSKEIKKEVIWNLVMIKEDLGNFQKENKINQMFLALQ